MLRVVALEQILVEPWMALRVQQVVDDNVISLHGQPLQFRSRCAEGSAAHEVANKADICGSSDCQPSISFRPAPTSNPSQKGQRADTGRNLAPRRITVKARGRWIGGRTRMP
jgi:hypothetical protein